MGYLGSAQQNPGLLFLDQWPPETDLVMTKSRSTGGACPLIPLASLMAKPRVGQSLTPHQQEAKASYMG